MVLLRPTCGLQQLFSDRVGRFNSPSLVFVAGMNRRKLKLDMTATSASDPTNSETECNKVENYVNNVKEQIMNTTQHNDSDYVWQECYDDVSGFIYYWNTQTNKVTWEKPEHYDTTNIIENQDVSNTNKNSRKRLSSDSLPTLDPNSCNSSKKSKLESKAISALVAYDSDSSDGENEDEEDKKCTILQRLQQKAEMFKQKEMDKLTNDKSPNLCKTNSQPDILDIIGEEVPPDYEIETHNVLKSEKKPTGDIFDILKSEIPPDYMDDITNNLSEEDSKKSIELDSKLTAKCQSKTVENGSLSKCHSNIDARTNGTILDSVKENSSKSFNLIANYSDEDLEDSDQKIELNDKTLSYVQDPSANLKTGFGYSVPSKHTNGSSINFVKGETMNLQNNQVSEKTNVVTKQQKDVIKHCDIKNVKMYIEDLSLLISSKLHFLSDCENNEKLSSVQIMTIKIDTLIEAWKDNSLNDEYFSKWLDEMAIELSTLEESVAPDGWTCHWDKINTRYYYQNVVDGRTQWQYPNEESECPSSSPVLSKASTPPLPNISDLNTSHPEPVDMDIEDDNHKEDTEIIVPPVPGDELSYELNSFYADLAQFESKPLGQIETMIAVPIAEKIETAPKLNNTLDVVNNSLEEEKEIVKPKKKKKVGKLDVGLGLKQKYVSSLVQKWQQIQNEIK